MEMQETQCATMVRLLAKQSSVMESVMMKPLLPRLTLMAPSAATQKTAPIIKVGIGAGNFACQKVLPATAATKPLITSPESPAMGFVLTKNSKTLRLMLMATPAVNTPAARIVTNAGTSAETGTGIVSVEQSDYSGTVPNTAACYHKIAAPIVGLTEMETPRMQCAPLVRLSAKQSSVMESAMMKPMLPRLTLMAP